MEQTSNFKLIISILFGIFIVAGVAYLVIAPGKKGELRGTVTVWGISDEKTMSDILAGLDSSSLDIFYEQKDAGTYGDELIEAFASGSGPDVFIMTDEMVVRFRDKTYPFSRESVTERMFRDTFVEAGEVFLSDGTAIALPFFVDPLVLYWNRDIFSSAGVARVPETWTELVALIPKLAQYGEKGEILRPAVSLGEFSNITHAKGILATLFLQTGSNIVVSGKDGLELGFVDGAAQSVIRFYTEFARPGKETYTWNRSMQNDRDVFASGDMPIYIGYASERNIIAEQNPHLNIDMALVPQLSEGGRTSVYAKTYAAAVSKTTDNPSAALYVASGMASADIWSTSASVLGGSSARRALLDTSSTDRYRPIIDASTLIGRTWLDPDADMSYTVFKDTVESITSGRERLSEAVYVMQQDLLRYIKERGLGTGIK